MNIIAHPHGPLRPHFTNESANSQSLRRGVCSNKSSLGRPGAPLLSPPDGLEELLRRCWARLRGGRPGGGDARSPSSPSFRGCSEPPPPQKPTSPRALQAPSPGSGEVSLQPKACPEEGPSCVPSTGLGGSAHTVHRGAQARPPLDQREESGEL